MEDIHTSFILMFYGSLDPLASPLFSPWHKPVDTNGKQVTVFHFGIRTDLNKMILQHRILWNASPSQTPKNPLMEALINAPIHLLGRLVVTDRQLLMLVRKCQFSFSKVIWTICGRVLKSLGREKWLIKTTNPEIDFLLLKNNSRKEWNTFAETFVVVIKEKRN